MSGENMMWKFQTANHKFQPEAFSRSNGLRWNARPGALRQQSVALGTKFRFAIALFNIFALITLFHTTAHAQIPKIDVDQSTVQYAKITDPRIIRLFLDDFMIPDDGITSLVIYDLNGDGFGEGDLARTYPAGKVYLTTPTPKVQRLMNNWSFGGNVKFTANAHDDPERFENAPDSVRAMGGIFASLLRGIRRNYQGMPIKIYLEQSDDVASVQIWGYDPNLMKYKPLPVNKVPEEVPVMKLIYLEKTVVDSVYTGGPVSSKQ
jgi:hypothetical protein